MQHNEVVIIPGKKGTIAAKSKKKKKKRTQGFEAVTHPSTDWTQCCLTSAIGRELICSQAYQPLLKKLAKIVLLKEPI